MEIGLSIPVRGRGRGRGVVIKLDEGQSQSPLPSSSAPSPPHHGRQEALALSEEFEGIRPFPVLGRGRRRPKAGAKQLTEVVPETDPEWGSSFEHSDIRSAVIKLEPSVSSSSSSPIGEEDLSSLCSRSRVSSGSGSGVGKATEPEDDELTELTPEQSMTQLKLTNFGTIGLENITGQKEEAKGEDPVCPAKVGPPEKQIDLMTEFREDAVLSPKPILHRFCCCICGFPAGKDTYTCYNKGHSTCVDCFTDFGVHWCHYLMKDEDGRFYCRASLHQFPTIFRDFIFDNTKVNCMNYTKGCEFQGVWEEVKGHRASCEFSTSTTERE